MKVYNVFHLNLLHKDSDNLLSDQIQKSSESIITADNEKWQLADIVNFCWHYDCLQYCCVWVDEKIRDLK